jgi:HAD superfamily hydrolase (TIGR01509 family)
VPLRAIVFDFDGLIADTEWPEYRAVAEQFERHDLEYPPAGWAHVLGSVWAVDWLSDLEARLRRPVDRARLEADRRRRALALRTDLAPLPGVVELLEAAADAGLGLAVASSSPRSWVEPHLQRLGLARWFDAVRTRDDVELAKPAPDLFLAACTALGVPAADAVALEDSANGTTAACTAGLACVAVPNRLTRHLDLSHADLVVGSLLELDLERLRALVEGRAPADTG